MTTYHIAASACDCGMVHIDVADASGRPIELVEIVQALRDAATFIESERAELLDVRPHRTH